ncbi:hypothetical protein FEM48_Zijuj06G0175500 [Ziziphus jujuba var. spinosa]|uniref:FAS1 domain-containing protein n=1 Tax=Ziziphus jujuba var. spinosa TaxID=714518 RepID=A0A978VAN3_ZIZJJ|nr:hypothetical protein FEM48_Zijuj06G0175500 [Ziziphus jujuba var. spinosa]
MMGTIFAPVDQSMVNPINNVSIFLRHDVPCKLLWNDLVNFDDGTVLPTYSNGFTITVTRSDSVLMLNGVPVFSPNIYFSDPIVVHTRFLLSKRNPKKWQKFLIGLEKTVTKCYWAMMNFEARKS